MKAMLKFLLVLALLTIGASPSEVKAERTWNACSGFDSSDSQTSYGYDLDYICASQFSEEPNEISFFLFFRTIVSPNQFNNSYGSWAAMTIDTNYDGEFDLYVRTTNATLQYDRRTVAGRAVRNGQTIGCPVEVWTDLGAGAKWLGLSINKDCAAINGIGLNLMGYADSEYYTNSGFDFAPTSAFYVGPPGNAPTTTTTTTTTTIPKVAIPNSPSSTTITKISENALRISWLDNSTNEDGFLIQRNDLPVPAGTSIQAWPYKAGANSPAIEFGNLVPNRSYCFSIAAFNSAGSSSFTESSCYNLVSSQSPTQSTSAPNTLTCDGTRVSSNSKTVQIIVDTGASNAGKALKFEIYKSGKWIPIGIGRTSKAGSSAVSASLKTVGKKGSLPIRATQGSRFICEGTLD